MAVKNLTFKRDLLHLLRLGLLRHFVGSTLVSLSNLVELSLTVNPTLLTCAVAHIV